jgi:hypothetical protein
VLLRPRGPGRQCTGGSAGSMGHRCLGGRAGRDRGSGGFGRGTGCFVSRTAGGFQGLGELPGDIHVHPRKEGASVGLVVVGQGVPPTLTADRDEAGNGPHHVHLVPRQFPTFVRPRVKDLKGVGKHIEEVAHVFSLRWQNWFYYQGTSRG